MTIQQLTDDQLRELPGSAHPAVGFDYPPPGLQPYYDWLVRTLHLLGEASCSALRVARDTASDTSIHIAPGRASISGVALDQPGQTIDLAAHDDDTALLWLYDDAGSAAIGVAGAAAGDWPATAHIKLAEVTLEAGRITAIHDRRFETVFRI